ncbi:MAG: tetratricopeptide repeat protein [Ktedonobacteraceae bacterium]
MPDDMQKHIVLLNQRVVQLNQQAQYEQAIEMARLACDLASEHLGADHPFLATSLNNLAELYRATGHYDQAETLYQEALAIRRATFGETHPAVAAILHNLAGLYLTIGDYAGAGPPLLRSLEIRRTTLGEMHLDVSQSLSQLALLRKLKGSYAQAEPLYQEALHIRSAILGTNHPAVATTLNNLAELYQAMGNYSKAEPLYQQALEIKRTTLGDLHPDVATCLNNLARLYYTAGGYAQAEALYQEALSLQCRALGETHPDVAGTLNNLAELYRARGNYKQAETLLQQALAVWGATPERVHLNMAVSLNNLGELYRTIGNYAKATALYEQAFAISRTAMGAAHPYVATILNNIAELYRQTGNYAQAEPLYHQSLAIRCTTLGEAHPEVAQSLNNLASLLCAKGDSVQAEPLYQQALSIRRSTLGGSHPDVAQCLSNLGVLSMSKGDYTGAEPLLQEALEITQKALGEGHPDVAHLLNNLALCCVATNRQREALPLLKQAAIVDDQVVGQVFSLSSEHQRMEYLKTLQGRFDGFLSFTSRVSADSTEAVQAALDLTLRRKGIGAEALAVQRDVILNGRYPALESRLRELSALRMQIAQKTLTGPGPEGVEAHLQHVKKWNLQRERWETELAHQIPEMNLSKRLQNIDHRLIAKELPEGAAVVEFVLFDVFDFSARPVQSAARWSPAHYAAFVIQAGKPEETRFVDLGDASLIDRLVGDFITAVTSKAALARHLKAGSSLSERRSYQSIGTALRKILFAPLQDALGGCTRVFLSPDGELTRLPFETLPTGDGHYVIDDYQISYLSTGRDIVRLNAAVLDQSALPLVVADPDFDLSDAAAPVSAATGTPRGRRSRDLNHDPLRFEHLPGTRVEGQRVADLLGVQPMLDGAALEGTLKAFHSPRILHIATHGFFLPDQHRIPDKEGTDLQTIPEPTMSRLERFLEQPGENPLLHSGLALAGANTWNRGGSLPPEAEDGLLTAEDVSGLDLLDTKLVVLSACETGLGQVKVGEGVFGLRRAFVLAGARTLVMSLWKVSDGHTRELMGEFYRHLLAGRSRVDALRVAQLAMKEKDMHPYYWGAFICQGDPDPFAL